MSGRHRTATERAARHAKLAGAGVAGLTAVFAVSPFAHAAPAKPTPSDSPAAPAKAATKVTKPKPLADDTSTTTSTEVPTPNFGEQKIRVGVQIDPKADVPTGTNTGGTIITIQDTGPFASEAANLYGDSCTTVAGSEEPPSTETYCQFLLSDNKKAQLKRALAKAGVSARQLAALDPFNDYLQFPGDTVTFTQKTVNKNLVIDSHVLTFPACVTPIIANGKRRAAAAADDPPTCSNTPVPALFTDEGKPPIARNDARTTGPGEPVTIKVVDNDSLQGAKNITGVKKITDPKHGTAKVEGKPGPATDPAPTIVYTPAAGFAGVDTFKYTLSTANGSDTATVTVTVPAAPTSSSSSGAGNKNLADTGSDSMALLDLSAVLLVVGASATVVGRRRRVAARHGRIG
jgi:hypothetical protein